MFNVILDENNFFIKVKDNVDIQGGNVVKVESLPEVESSSFLFAYSYENGEWVKHEDKYAEIQKFLLSSIVKSKKDELGKLCTSKIEYGVDVELTDGETKHFSLTNKDQMAINSLYDSSKTNDSMLLWHSDNGLTQEFSKEDIAKIYFAAKYHVMYHQTLINYLNRTVESYTSADQIRNMTYSESSLSSENYTKFYNIIALYNNYSAIVNAKINDLSTEMESDEDGVQDNND